MSQKLYLKNKLFIKFPTNWIQKLKYNAYN